MPTDPLTELGIRAIVIAGATILIIKLLAMLPRLIQNVLPKAYECHKCGRALDDAEATANKLGGRHPDFMICCECISSAPERISEAQALVEIDRL